MYALAVLILACINTTVLAEPAFKHDFHAKQQKISCKRCHGFARFEKSRDLMDKKLCHSCHVDKGPQRALLSCKKCHGDVKVKTSKLYKPAYHNALNFKTEHGPFASSSKQNCMSCHKKDDCSDCHNKARSLSRSPHSAYFIMTHGQDAKMGKSNCTNCHSKSTCTECHRKSL
jgi:hypothetical protein